MRRKAGPWDAEGETGLSSAIAHARELGLIPLIIDNTAGGKVEAFWLDQDVETRSEEGERIRPRVQILDAASILPDERRGVRTRALIIKESRLQLIAAMRHGQTFFVRLKDKSVDFPHYSKVEKAGSAAGATGLAAAAGSATAANCSSSSPTSAYSDPPADAAPADAAPPADKPPEDPGMPWASVFDQRIWNDLAKYTRGTAECAAEAARMPVGNCGLWDSGHPLAKLLKEGDCDYDGTFFIKQGFGVVVCTTKSREEYVELLRMHMPLRRFQPIEPWP